MIDRKMIDRVVRWEQDHPSTRTIMLTVFEGQRLWEEFRNNTPGPHEIFSPHANVEVLGHPVKWVSDDRDSDLYGYYDAEETTVSQWTRQEGGNHYKQFKIQPSEYIWKNNLTWFAANIVKYATRAPFKGKPVEDLRKVIHYAQLWIEEITNEREEAEAVERAANPVLETRGDDSYSALAQRLRQAEKKGSGA